MLCRGCDSQDVVWLHIAVAVVQVMHLFQCMGKSLKLNMNVSDQGYAEMWLCGPELAQIPSVGPLEHEISLLASSYRGDEFDNVGALQSDDRFVCSDFSLPSCVKFALSFRVFVIGAVQFLDGKIGLPMINHIHVSIF